MSNDVRKPKPRSVKKNLLKILKDESHKLNEMMSKKHKQVA